MRNEEIVKCDHSAFVVVVNLKVRGLRVKHYTKISLAKKNSMYGNTLSIL